MRLRIYILSLSRNTSDEQSVMVPVLSAMLLKSRGSMKLQGCFGLACELLLRVLATGGSTLEAGAKPEKSKRKHPADSVEDFLRISLGLQKCVA